MVWFSKSASSAVLACAAAMGVAGAAVASDITYTVNEVIPGGSVTGTITTDGATGPLGAADFLSWSLQLSGPGATYHISNTDPGAVAQVGNDILLLGIGNPDAGLPYVTPDNGLNPNAGNADVTADATHIYFNYDGVDGGYLGFQDGAYSGAHYWCNATSNQGYDCAPGTDIVPIDVFLGGNASSPETGNQVLATAAPTSGAPEPATWAMMLTGVALAGAAARFRRRDAHVVG